MSVGLNQVAIDQFIDEVSHALKEITYSDQLLEKHTANGGKIKRNIVGELLKAPNYGDVFMGTKGNPTEEITASTISKERKQTSFDDKVLLVYIDEFSQQEINWSDLEAHKEALIDAKMREDNQFVIDKLAAETYNTDPEDISAGYVLGTTGAPEIGSVDTLRKVKKIMDDKGVPTKGRVACVNPAFVEQLLQDEKFISNDYTNKKVLVDGQLTSFMGFNFIELGNKVDPVTSREYGLPRDGASSTVECFFYQTSGVLPGFRAMADRPVNVDWENNRQSHSVVITTSGGCLIRQPATIVKVVVDNSL